MAKPGSIQARSGGSSASSSQKSLKLASSGYPYWAQPPRASLVGREAVVERERRAAGPEPLGQAMILDSHGSRSCEREGSMLRASLVAELGLVPRRHSAPGWAEPAGPGQRVPSAWR